MWLLCERIWPTGNLTLAFQFSLLDVFLFAAALPRRFQHSCKAPSSARAGAGAVAGAEWVKQIGHWRFLRKFVRLMLFLATMRGGRRNVNEPEPGWACRCGCRCGCGCGCSCGSRWECGNCKKSLYAMLTCCAANFWAGVEDALAEPKATKTEIKKWKKKTATAGAEAEEPLNHSTFPPWP